jgi:hypothetical protein
MQRCRVRFFTHRTCGFIFWAGAGFTLAACSRSPSPDADITINFVVNADGSLSPRTSFTHAASGELNQTTSGVSMSFPQTAISLASLSQCDQRIMVGAVEIEGQPYAIVLIPQESHQATVKVQLDDCP